MTRLSLVERFDAPTAVVRLVLLDPGGSTDSTSAGKQH
jgi:hypothetical protein